MRNRFFASVIVLLLLVMSAARAYQDTPEYGPAKGTLVIVGGGTMEGTGIVEKFIQLAGGPDRKFIIVPTAGGNKSEDGSVRAYQALRTCLQHEDAQAGEARDRGRRRGVKGRRAGRLAR